MAIPTFVNVGTAAPAASGDVTPGNPGSIANLDILVCHIGTKDNVECDMPAGWTRKFAVNNGASSRTEIWWKRTNGTEGSNTVTHTGGDAIIARIAAWRGCITVYDPFDTAAYTAAGAGTGITFPSIHTTIEDCLVLLFLQATDDVTVGSWANSALSSVTERWDSNTALGTDMTLAGASGGYAAQHTGAATGTSSATLSGTASKIAVTLGLRPASAATGSSTMPEWIVEWLPDQGPGVTDGTWQPLTAHITGARDNRGRLHELDLFDSGEFSLTLEVGDRRYDDEWTSGPYYGQLIPMRQIRVVAVWAGVTYPHWRGYITDWGNTHIEDRFFVSQITCRDGFERLARNELGSSAWALEIQRDAPDLWFRLGETDTARVTDSSGGGNYGIYDNVEQGVEGLVPNDADGAVRIGHTTDERVTVQNPLLISGYSFTVEAMISTESDSTKFKVIFSGLVDPTDANPGWEIGVDDGTDVGRFLMVARNGGSALLKSSATLVDDGRPHIVAARFIASNDYQTYVDGVNDVWSAGGTATWPGNPPNGYVIGNYPDVGFGDFGFDGIIDEVVVWDSDVDPVRLAAHAAAALTGWDGDNTGDRVTRFLDAIEWPDDLRDIDDGISILGPASWSAGASALSVMQGWASTELGAFFMGKSGEIVWRSRHYSLLDSYATTSQATIGDAHSTAAIKADDIVPIKDAALIRNPVTASRAGGVSVTVKDQTLIDNKYGSRTWAMPNSEDQKDSAIHDRAVWGLGLFKELNTRIATIIIDPRRNPSQWATLLGLDLGHRITVKRTPLGTGNEISVDQIIERIEWSWDKRNVTLTLGCSPVDPNVGSYLILNDASEGLLDTGVLAY